MNLLAIYNQGLLSVRSYNVCANNGLLDLDLIQGYFKVHGTFLKLRNCGAKSNKELESLCENQELQTLDDFPLRGGVQEIRDIEVLYQKRLMSKRVYNVCRNNNLTTVEAIKEYYYRIGSFQQLRHCGLKSVKELLQICERGVLMSSSHEFIQNISLYNLVDKRDFLSESRYEVINLFIIIKLNLLSKQVRLIVDSRTNKIYDVMTLLRAFKIGEGLEDDIHSVSRESKKELQAFISKVSGFVDSVVAISKKDELDVIRRSIEVARAVNTDYLFVDTIGDINVFNLFHHWLLHGNQFSETEREIIHSEIEVFSTPESFDECLRCWNMTLKEPRVSRERVRQLKGRLILLFSQIVISLKKEYADRTDLAALKLSNSFFFLDNCVSDKLNEQNHISFSMHVNAFLVDLLLQEDFVCLQESKDIIFNKKNQNSKRIPSCYFYIPRDFLGIIDFKGYHQDLLSHVGDKRWFPKYSSFPEYLGKFAVGANPIAEDVLNCCLGIFEILFGESWGDVVNKSRLSRPSVNLVSCVRQVLSGRGEPASVMRLKDELLIQFPALIFTDGQLLAALKRSNGFVPVSRTSTYGLAEWELCLPSFRGGTLKDIAIEYLGKHSQPVHIIELSRYIEGFRGKRSIHSLLQNMKVDVKARFVFYPLQFIGLASGKEEHSSCYSALPPQLGKRLHSLRNQGHSNSDLISYVIVLTGLDDTQAGFVVEWLDYVIE
jgi:hypothetical protein